MIIFRLAPPDHPTCNARPWHRYKRVVLWMFMVGLASTTWVDAAETFSGYLDFGVRRVDVDGSDTKYRQHFNLDSGVRLSGLGLVFLPEEKTAFSPDRVEVFATNIGAEPFQNFRIGVRKYGSYRFSYQRQKSEYFYQDNLIDPADEESEMSNDGDFHHFDFDRIRDHLDFDVQISDRAKLLLDLDQYTKQGDSTTVLDIEREEFKLEQPIDQILKNYNIGFEYRWDQAAVTFNQRWRDFYNDIEIFLIGPSEGSNPVDPTQLDSFFLEQPYGYDSQETQVDLTFRPTESLTLQANVLYADLDLDVNSLEMATGIDFLGGLLLSNLTGESRSMRTIRQLYLSSGYAITDNIRLTASLRDQELEQNSDLDLDSVEGMGEWNIDSRSVAIALETIIQDDWTLSGGMNIEDRETTYHQSIDSSDFDANETSDFDGYFLMLGYRPSNGLTLNLSAENNIIDDPFTLSSPSNSHHYRLRIGYKWDIGLKLSSTYAWRQSENKISGWEANSKQTHLRLTYINDPITLALGTTFVDLDRSIDQLVTGGSVQVLFPIAYRADSDFWDGLISWQATKQVNVKASYRHYENEGSFEVKRNDARLGIIVDLHSNYSFGANYRNIDYTEDFEAFDAEIWELTFGLRW